jgi:hypothetical protein
MVLLLLMTVCKGIAASCVQYKGSEIAGSDLIYTTASMVDSSK